jgi:hypothetical protein
MTNERELRATSDLMLEQLSRLRLAEEAKRRLVPGTREFAELAFEVVERSRTTLRWAEIQLRQANASLAEPGVAPSPLVDVRARRLDQVLAEWRQAEIRLSQAIPGADADEAAALVDRLREEYRRLQDRKMEGRDDG